MLPYIAAPWILWDRNSLIPWAETKGSNASGSDNSFVVNQPSHFGNLALRCIITP